MSAGLFLARRQLTAGLAASLAMPSLLLPARSSAAQPAVVETTSGKIRGAVHKGAHHFKGVPYAAATSGRNRFMAPRPVSPWAGTRDMTCYGERCPQPVSGAEPVTGARYGEDCCVLNVYTPEATRRTKRPVMVFIHGGGFRSGSGDTPLLDGTNLALSGDVVVVTLNHRLNVLGFANLGHFDPDFADAGNAGQLDLVAALQWVQANIDAFGGDPARVLVFGVSGGGSSVETLLVMPQARGLFHSAINMSGSSAFAMRDAQDMQPVAELFLRKLGVAQRDLRKLQALPPEQLRTAYDAAFKELKAGDFRPTVDGTHIPQAPMSKAGLALLPPVPTIMSRTATEASAWLAVDPRNRTVSLAQLRARIAAQFGLSATESDAVIDRYRSADPDRSPWDLLVAVASDALVRRPMLQWARAKAEAKRAPVYFLDFNWKSKKDGGVWGAAHGIDVGFAFGNLDANPLTAGQTADVRPVVESEMGAFVALAGTGRPHNPALPDWTPFDTAGQAMMVIDSESKLVRDFRSDDRRAADMLPMQDAFDIVQGPLMRFAA